MLGPVVVYAGLLDITDQSTCSIVLAVLLLCCAHGLLLPLPMLFLLHTDTELFLPSLPSSSPMDMGAMPPTMALPCLAFFPHLTTLNQGTAS